mgnify:CR=1 FL=1
MIKKLVAHGNSAALVIDKPILQLLKADENTSFEITTDGRSLILSPVSDAKREKRFSAALDKINKLHGKTLRKLAE